MKSLFNSITTHNSKIPLINPLRQQQFDGTRNFRKSSLFTLTAEIQSDELAKQRKTDESAHLYSNKPKISLI